VTDDVVLLEYYRAVAPTVGSTGKPQLVLCSYKFSQRNKNAIKCLLYDDILYQNLLILTQDC